MQILKVIFILCLSSISYATFSVVPMGMSEGLQANTGTGNYNSSFPSYYNPAALSWVQKDHFSLSGLGFNSISAKSQQLNFKSERFSTANVFSVITSSMGNVAFFLYLPRDIESKFENSQWLNLQSGEIGTGRFSIREQWTVGGLSFAPRNETQDWWSYGFNLQFEYRDLQSSSLLYKINSSGNGGSFTSGESRKNHLGLSISFGSVYQITPRLSFGYVLTSPSLQITRGNTGDTLFLSYNYESSNAFLHAQQSQSTTPLASLPLRARSGLHWQGSNLSWSLDYEFKDQMDSLERQHNLTSGLGIRVGQKSELLMGVGRSLTTNLGINDSYGSRLTFGYLNRDKILSYSIGTYTWLPIKKDENTSSIYGLIFNTLYNF